jgi:hypothetical protein
VLIGWLSSWTSGGFSHRFNNTGNNTRQTEGAGRAKLIFRASNDGLSACGQLFFVLPWKT